MKTIICHKCWKVSNYMGTKPEFCPRCKKRYKIISHTVKLTEWETKKRTLAQVRANENRRDIFRRIKIDMIDHIMKKIKQGYYTPGEYLADPDVYHDSAIMGNYVKNPILNKSIAAAIKKLIYGE